MKILSKTQDIKFSGSLSLELIENFFKINNINALRWAVINADKGILTIAYAHFE